MSFYRYHFILVIRKWLVNQLKEPNLQAELCANAERRADDEMFPLLAEGLIIRQLCTDKSENLIAGMMYWLWALNKSVSNVQKNWRIIHLFYNHKDYTYNDTIEYDEVNIKKIENTLARIARWIMYGHEEPFTND